MRNLEAKWVAGFFSCVWLLVIARVSLRAQGDANYGVTAMKNVMVPMRDGVKLAVDIYRPSRNGQPIEGRFPVILTRTPYNKEDAAPTANSFVPYGYVVVLQDVRGR